MSAQDELDAMLGGDPKLDTLKRIATALEAIAKAQEMQAQPMYIVSTDDPAEMAERINAMGNDAAMVTP